MSTERSVTEATEKAVEVIKQNFPDAHVDKVFLAKVVEQLGSKGFQKGNSIALVNTCRDEITRPLTSFIDNEFGHSFNIAGLGGVITSGKTGFGAALAHGPKDAEHRTKYIFFAFPHIAVDEKGEIGAVARPGLHHSHACGALLGVQSCAKGKEHAPTAVAKSKGWGFRKKAAEKVPADVIDESDVEFSVLKKKLLELKQIANAGPDGPDLVTVTKAALEVINKDIEYIISQIVDTSKADYAVVTGVQIHSGAQVEGEEFQWSRALDYISPSLLYTVVRGVKWDFSL